MLADPPNLISPLARGEPVQMVVLSDGRSFARFRVLREAFLPRRGLWLSEEAALERPLFESLQAHVVPAVLNKLDAGVSRPSFVRDFCLCCVSQHIGLSCILVDTLSRLCSTRSTWFASFFLPSPL